MIMHEFTGGGVDVEDVREGGTALEVESERAAIAGWEDVDGW